MRVIEYLQGFNAVSVVVRLVLAILFAGVIGFERRRKRRAAGFRTYMLVSVGATLAMLTDQYVALQLGGSSPTRIAAQVVSGVGFLGAGTIIVTGRNQIRGLTTAAGLWACACMGLALGSGFYLGALAGFVLIFIVIALMSKIDKGGDHQMIEGSLFIEGKEISILGGVSGLARGEGLDCHFEKIEHVGDRVQILLHVRIEDEAKLFDFSRRILELPGVLAAEEIG